MREVVIIGVGQTSIGEHWVKPLREIGGEAVFSTLRYANRQTADGIFVGNMLSGILCHQENLGTLIADWVGLGGIEAVKVEAACGSGVAALPMAVSPGEINLFDLHDAFSIMAALSLEACGFVERGQGPRLGLDGQIFPGGKIPIATFGGLKAHGHPVGATGIYQVLEIVLQLRGTAESNQVPGAKIGMAQNIGGSGSNITTHILRRENP